MKQNMKKNKKNKNKNKENYDIHFPDDKCANSKFWNGFVMHVNTLSSSS